MGVLTVGWIVLIQVIVAVVPKQTKVLWSDSGLDCRLSLGRILALPICRRESETPVEPFINESFHTELV